MSPPAVKFAPTGQPRAKRMIVYFAVLVFLLYLLLSSLFFTVDQTQRAIVLQFGKPVGGVRETGLHAKIPFIQKVVYFDNRLMEYDVGAAEIYTNDKKNMVVDAFVRWRISDPLLFYQRYKSDNSYSIIEEAKRRLGAIIVGELRRELGLHIMQEIISQNRGSIMTTVTDSSNRKLAEDTRGEGGAAHAAIEVTDVRIKRADLPPENQKSVYDRMRTEREQQATKYRSEGRRNGQRIMSEADRRVRELIAEAEMQSQVIRGEADAEAASIYAGAYGQDPEFYAFKRSLESYQTAFKTKSLMVVDPAETDYLRYFGTSKPPEGTVLGSWPLPPPSAAPDGAAPAGAAPDSKPAAGADGAGAPSGAASEAGSAGTAGDGAAAGSPAAGAAAE
jgi:membrane protease subunit HflC